MNDSLSNLKKDVVGILRKNGASMMAQILTTEPFSDLLNIALSGDYSLFVPTNKALDHVLDNLDMNEEQLLLHPALLPILRGHVYPDNIIRYDTITMLSGVKYPVTWKHAPIPFDGLEENFDIPLISQIDGIDVVFIEAVDALTHEYFDIEENLDATASKLPSLMIYIISGMLSTEELNKQLKDNEILKDIIDKINEQKYLSRSPRSGFAVNNILLNDEYYYILQIRHAGFLLSEDACDFLNSMFLNLAVQIVEEANIEVRYKGEKIVSVEELTAASRRVLPYEIFRHASKEGIQAMNHEFMLLIDGRKLYAIMQGLTKVDLEWLLYESDDPRGIQADRNKNYFIGVLQYIIEDILDLAAQNYAERENTAGGENAIIIADLKKAISSCDDYLILFGRFLYL
jgi:hypothetical protein